MYQQEDGYFLKILKVTSIRAADAVRQITKARTGQIHFRDESNAVVQIDQVRVVGWKEACGAAVSDLLATDRLRHYGALRVAQHRTCAAGKARMRGIG